MVLVWVVAVSRLAVFCMVGSLSPQADKSPAMQMAPIMTPWPKNEVYFITAPNDFYVYLTFLNNIG